MLKGKSFLSVLVAGFALACSSHSKSETTPRAPDTLGPEPVVTQSPPPVATGPGPSQNLNSAPAAADSNADFVKRCKNLDAETSQKPLLQSLILLVRIEKNSPANTPCDLIWNDLKYRREVTLSDNNASEGDLVRQRNTVNAHIADISLLGTLTNLQRLTVVNTQANVFKSLTSLVHLKSLTAYGQEISDTSFLKDLTNLRSLVLGSVHAQSVQGWTGLLQLEKLVLVQNTLESLDAWNLPTDGNSAQLNKLTLAKLESNKLSRIDGIENAPHLRDLSVADNNLKQLGSITKLRDLRTLNIRGNGISSLANIRALSELAVLDASENPLANLKDFSKEFQNKKIVSLVLNHMSNLDLSGIENLPQLQSLSVAGSSLQSLQPLKVLVALSELNLAGTNLQSLSQLPILPALTRLDLSGNTALTDLSGLSGLALTDLSLKGISSLQNSTLSTLFKNTSLLKLHSLDLRETGLNDLSFLSVFGNAKLKSLKPNSDCDIFQNRELNILLDPESPATASCTSLAAGVGKYQCIRYDPTGLTLPQTELNFVVRCLSTPSAFVTSDPWSEN